MHFFHLIQQSALHLYHSALPLSPRSSSYLARTISEKTVITGSRGRPDAWGIVVRSITASSQHLTRMATFGHKIAAAYDDDTVGIYDSVTGVLRLSLSLPSPVQAINGSPDGSVLFCAHKSPSITAWDMQTGGLIHTFGSERSTEHITVSSKGRYIGCGLSDGSVEVREVADTMEGASIWTNSPVTDFCWLEPEEQLAVSTGGLVRVWDIVTGTVLHSHAIQYPVRRMAYSKKYNQLAIMACSEHGGTVTVINPHTGTSPASHWIFQNLSCATFSQTSKELVCGMETPGIQLFDISTRRLKHIEYPDRMISVSSLQNGTVVANFLGSGIQLLSLDGTGQSSSQQPTISPLSMHALDQNKIIAIFQTGRDPIVLLDLATLSRLLEIPIPSSVLAPNFTIPLVSYKNQMTLCYFEEGDEQFLQLWRFHMEAPRWTVKVDGVPEIGSQISPTGAWLVTLHTADGLGCVCVWNTENGQLLGRSKNTSPPFDIEFTSDTNFTIHDSKKRTFCFVHLGELSEGVTLLPLNKRSPDKKSQEKVYLSVDNTREWVVVGPKRVGWIPPGYIRSTEPNHCFVGYTLVMVGQDGTLRSLTFSFPRVEHIVNHGSITSVS